MGQCKLSFNVLCYLTFENGMNIISLNLQGEDCLLIFKLCSSFLQVYFTLVVWHIITVLYKSLYLLMSQLNIF